MGSMTTYDPLIQCRDMSMTTGGNAKPFQHILVNLGISNLGDVGTCVYHHFWNLEIWDFGEFGTRVVLNVDMWKLINVEAKIPRNQETSKLRSQDTNNL